MSKGVLLLLGILLLINLSAAVESLRPFAGYASLGLIGVVGLMLVGWLLQGPRRWLRSKRDAKREAARRAQHLAAAQRAWQDVVLDEEIKEELLAVQKVLLGSKDYRQKWGQELPKGMILYGPSGTGKTMIAKTLARGAGYSFLSASAAEIKGSLHGESERAVHNFYSKAREEAPCIVFFDEIDAVAASRGNGFDGGSRADNSTVNQLLIELDGFEESSGVFTIGATNRLDILDDAVRSRLSTQVHIGLPSLPERLALLQINTRAFKTRLARDVNLEMLASLTEGYSGRDLEMLCRRAVLKAFSRDKERVGLTEFRAAMQGETESTERLAFA